MEDCIFCKIANGVIPVEKVLSGKHAIMFHDKNPIAPVHLLVISKKHYDNFHDLAAQDRGVILTDMFGLVDQYILEDEELSEDGYRIVMNTGKNAGQTVLHVHIHLIGGATLKNDFGA